MLNRMRTSIWHTNEEKVLKIAINGEMVKSTYLCTLQDTIASKGLYRHVENSFTPLFGLNVKQIGISDHLCRFGTKKYSPRMLINPFNAKHILKITKVLRKKNKFANLRVTFGRSPNVTYGTFLTPISSKFNAESIARNHLAHK